MVKRLGTAALVLLTACDTGFRPETLVEKLRVLGMRSTPADLHPGEVARLESLLLDPSRPGKPNTTLWIGCDPDPFNLNRSACSDPAVLQDPSALGDPDAGLPPGVHLIGFNAQAAYAAPADLFSVLAPDDERRTIGTAGQALAIAVADEVSPAAPAEELRALFERVQRKEVPSTVALFRVHISENPERNHNPPPGTLLLEGVPLVSGAHLAVKPAQTLKLDLTEPDSAFEPYTNVTPSGSASLTERILLSWYSTTGRFSETRTAVNEDVKTDFTAPGGSDKEDPVPDDRRGTLWIILRDTRGGQSWQQFEMFVCDDSLAEPTVTAATPPASAIAPLTLQGDHLDSLLDVFLGDTVVRDGHVVGDHWEGTVPPGLTGVQHLTWSSKRCTHGGALDVTLP